MNDLLNIELVNDNQLGTKNCLHRRRNQKKILCNGRPLPSTVGEVDSKLLEVESYGHTRFARKAGTFSHSSKDKGG